MCEDLPPAKDGETAVKTLENEVHVVTRLLERAPWDLAIQTFLVRVFLSLPRHLKACRRVCSSWNTFINEQVGKLIAASPIGHQYIFYSTPPSFGWDFGGMTIMDLGGMDPTCRHPNPRPTDRKGKF